MTRAYHIELTVLRDYGKQLILLGILVAALVSIGTRNLIIAPVYFHFGQTKATQAMPAIIIFIVFVPAMLLGYSGLLDTGSAGMTMLTDFIAAITTPVGACCTLAVAVIVAAATMALSAAVSLRLYERREL